MNQNPETSDLRGRCTALFAELELGTADSIIDVEPLSGGVSSDIAVVRTDERALCVKFARPKLKVAADWYAPVERNRAEYEWLRVAGDIAPDYGVKLYGRSSSLHGFAMEFIDGDDVYLWKDALLNGQVHAENAQKLGDMLGRLQATSSASDFDQSPFHNAQDFYALRIEPYIVYTAQQHPEVTRVLEAIAEMLHQSRQVLVHGDFSPKNIIFRDGRPVLLDAECATMGDASFDLAFCLNHLVLKAIHMPAVAHDLFAATSSLWDAYRSHVCWEPADALEERICRVIPALMLARVDGKSPVEYLDDEARTTVRTLSLSLLSNPASNLRALHDRLSAELRT